MSAAPPLRRFLATTILLTIVVVAGLLLAGGGLARRLAAERVAEVLVDAIPAEGIAACAAGHPIRNEVSEDLVFDYYSAEGTPVSPSASPLDPALVARLGEGRTAAETSRQAAEMLLRVGRAGVPLGPCAYARATWRYKAHSRLTAGGALFVLLCTLAALVMGAGSFLALRPFVAQLRELQRSARSLGRPRTGEDQSPFVPPRVLLFEASEVAAVLGAADRRIEEDAAHLRQRSEDLELLLGELTHDVRTPLASIQFALDEVAATAGPEALPALRRALSDVIYLNSLTDNMRLAERLQRGAPLVTAPMDVAELVRRAVDRAEPFALRRGVELIATVAPLTVAGDATALEQVVMNLLDNAVAYSEPGTHIRVSMVDRVLRVEDDGPGVSAEELPQLTTRYFRGASSVERPRSTKGTGLGLAIVHEVCARSGWQLRLTRPAQGGLAVSIEFPET